jgi:hypothetical protein
MSGDTLKVIKDAREYMRLCNDADGGNRDAALEDLKFSHGDQWPAELEMSRKLAKRPCLTINKTDTFVRSIVNNMRQQRPRIKVHAVGDGDVKVADVIQGLMRHIEINSVADLAYDTGAEYQVRMGWGYWRAAARYVEPDSFDQELYIDAIRNPFTVYFDPLSKMPDGSDQTRCLITERIKRKTFEKLYPKADPESLPQRGAGDDDAAWSTREEITVGEFYQVEETPDELYILSDGSKLYKSACPDAKTLRSAGVEIIKARDTMRIRVTWHKITGTQVLEGPLEIPGKYIPVFPVYGAELVIDGKVIRFGAVRHAKDPQRMYNFWRTSETEVVALAPKAPWLMAEGQDEGHEDEWRTANNANYSSLKYKPVTDENGTMLPPPRREQPQQIPSAQITAAQNASEDLKAVFGMFDPSLGAPGNETSGTMVKQRQGQSDLSNFHFYDNLTRTICHTAKVLLSWIPHYYDTKRIVRIIGEDGEPSSVTLNEKVMKKDEAGNETDEIEKVLNDVTTGLYDVVMDTGPGYQTKRQEAAAMFMDLLKTELGKQIGQLAGDIVVRQLDIPGIDKIADRLEAASPLAQLDKAAPEDMPDEAKAIIAAMMQKTQAMQKELQQLQQEKAAKIIGVQAQQQGQQQLEAMRQQAENQRLLAKEHAINERTAHQEQGEHERAQLAANVKLQDTQAWIAEERFEAILDAHTDLKLGADKGNQRNDPGE